MTIQMYVEVGITDAQIASAMHYDDEFAVNVLKAVANEVSPDELVDRLSEDGDLGILHIFAVALLRVVEKAMA